MKKTVCVDFDGVLNTYDGWKGERELFELRPGAAKFLLDLNKDFSIVIHTTRQAPLVWEWLEQYNLDWFIQDVTSMKPPAVAYIDDRGICFTGDYNQTLEQVRKFKAHWEKDEAADLPRSKDTPPPSNPTS